MVFLAVYSVGRHRVSVVWRPLDGRGSWWPAHGIGYVLIAKRLVVTNATVKSHLAHTYAKLGVQSRTEVIALARQRGLIS